MENNEFMLTTVDNPYDPFEQFDSWLMFDVEKGYNTCGKIARITKLSDDLTEQERDIELERACDEIIKFDFLDLYKKVKRNEQKPVDTEESQVSGDVKDRGEGS